MPDLVTLCPNRSLLDPDFDGYKLSLREITTKKIKLPVKIDRVLLSASQYSLLHAKLFGLHNHLFGDPFEENCVYFVDTDWHVNKVYVDSLSNDLIEPIQVWKIPKGRERETGDYNVSLKFISRTLCLLGDGTGLIYILKTGERNNDEVFTVVFTDEITGEGEAFIILDGILTEDNQLHVLLQSISQQKENKREQFSTLIHWINFVKVDEKWTQTALKCLKTNSSVHYAALESSCEAIYVASDNECKFILNSDNPVIEEPDVEIKKVYTWTQNAEDISVQITIPKDIKKELVCVKSEPTRIEVKYDSNSLICGPLYQRISADLTTWSINESCIEITLFKHACGVMWPEFVIGDQTGEHIIYQNLTDEVHEKLSHLCSENEVVPPSETTFNSQQIEECDFENDKLTVFERLIGAKNSVSHRINLGSYQVLLTANIDNKLPPALGIKHDVDVCLWQPQGRGDNFSMTHLGTLLALGYVQASKQNKKFLVCPPDMSYSVICESEGHIFIYRQKKPIDSGELRNRTSGKKILNIAEQQVVNVSGGQILGVYPFNSTLYVLTETSLIALKL